MKNSNKKGNLCYFTTFADGITIICSKDGKNHMTGNFEIARRSSGNMVYQGTLEQMVAKANDLKGEENTVIGYKNRR